MKTLRIWRKTLLATTLISSFLLIGTVASQKTEALSRVFTAAGAPAPTPTPPQPARPKRKTTVTTSTSQDVKPNSPLAPNSASTGFSMARILASADFNLIGLVGTVSPATQTVPKNIPTAVSTSVQVPPGEDPAPVIAQLNPNYRIRGELAGPSLAAPRTVEAKIGEMIPIQPLAVVGEHVLQNLRIVDVTDPTNSTLAAVAPDSIGITVIDNLLVTEVQVTEMTYEQIIQSGINLTDANYNFYNFVLALGTSSGAVPIQIPVALPATGGQLPVVGNPVGGVGPTGVPVPMPDIIPVMLEGVDEAGNPAPVELPGGGGEMRIPGVIVFPGRIGLLNQFFEAVVIVANGAPGGTPLVVTNLRARAVLPDGGTPNVPNDDPLRIAATQQGGVQSELPIRGLGADGQYGTADDTASFAPGQSGQAKFLLEGLREGLHTVNFNLEGTLQGLPTGNVTVRGTVPGAVLVRDAQFGVTFTHPSVVRAGQEYDLGLTVYNSGSRNLNGIVLSLRGSGVSGATLIDSEEKTLAQTIAPGSSGTVKWRLRSNTTGQVTASYVKVGDNIDAGLNLVTGVGDRNVPLSPDSLILPEPVRHLPPDVTEAARQMLGQAWSVATAPPGSLPAGVLPVDKQTVVGKAVELGWAGLRIDFGENRDTSLRTLTRDWMGEIPANSSAGFADALRNTPAGYYFFDTVGTKFFAEVGASAPADFHKKLLAAESSRSSLVSAYVSQPGGPQILGAKIVSPTNQAVGFGANAAERFGDLRTGASLNLLETDPHDAANNTRGNLLLVSKPTTSGNWSLEINGWADGAADISILAPTSGKNYRQLIFPNVAVAPGKRYRISFKATGTTAPVVEEFADGAFRGVNLAFTSAEVLDPNPEITKVVQVTEDVIEGGDKFGRLVGVLFSKPMAKTSVEAIARYQIAGGALNSDPMQIVGKPIKPTFANQNFGERFAILALDSPVGPFIRRTLAANNVLDKTGKPINGSPQEIEMRVSPRGSPPGGYLTGRVMQADGTPVPNAGIFYQRLKGGSIGGMQLAPCGMFSTWETVAYQKADANGEYAVDYVREGDCHPVTVRFQNTATNSEKTLVSNVAYHGQHLIFNAVFLARGNVQGTVTSGGVPLANANVSILSELDPLNNKLVKTDAQGFYSATGVPVGGVTVKAAGTGAYSLSTGIAAGSLNEAGGTATINVTTQNVSGIIQGRVLDSGGAGQPGIPNGLVVAKARIPGFPRIPDEPYTVGYAFTRADGSFTIDKLPVGTVYLEAIDPQRGVSTSATVELTAQSPKAENVIMLVSNGFGRVEGKVVNELGQTIPNAVVQEGAQAVRADAGGNYVLPRTREGNVTITATDPVTFQKGSTLISVRRNEDTTGADIVIRRPANLNGQVFITQNGATVPLAQAYVSVDGRRIVRTDAQGRYALDKVEAGAHLILRFVHPQGRLFVNTPVFLNPGETLSRNATFRPGRIHGKITQPDGRTPVVTTVTFSTQKPHFQQDIYFGLPEPTTLTYQTTTDGLYSFESLNPIGYRVSSANVFFPVTVSQGGVLPPNGDMEINLSLVDNLAGKIHGRIYQPDGVTPVGAGVKVSLGGGSLADVTVRTDAEGRYEFAEVFSEGGYVLKAVDPATGRTNQTSVSVRRNQDFEVDLRLLGRGSLKVKVVDGGGSPVPHGNITVEGSDYPRDGRFIELTPSSNGEFEFTNLTEGVYAVSALYQGLGGRVSGTVTIDGRTEVTVQVQAVGGVTGRVLMPGGAAPVGLADVTLRQNGRIIGLITTEDSEEQRGKFSFGYVPTGDFTIDVFDNRTGRSGRSAGRITAQGQIAEVNVNLLALGAVAGQVTSNGIPAEHALVHLSADGSGVSSTRRVTMTDAAGNYRFPGIPVGRVSVSVTNGPGGLTGHAEGIVAGTNEPLPDTIVNVALTPTASVAGTVYKFGGAEPYAGALVRVASNGFSVNTVTDETGRYRVNFVPLGTVKVKVESAFGYDRGKSAAIVSNQPGATVTADVTMAGVGSINGTATAAGGTPLAFGKVTFTNTAWGENITVVAPVQPNGTYSLTGVPAGDFNLKLTVPEIVGVGAAADVLTGNQSLVKNLRLEPAGKVFGTVKATDGATPAVGADVTLALTRQGGGNYTFITHTDASGNWSVDNLPLGTMIVRIIDSNAGGVAILPNLILNADGQQLDTGAVTLDATPISVVSVAPAGGAVNVPVNSAVQIVFSEPVDADTVDAGSVRINRDGNLVGSQRAISADGTIVTLTPSQPLAEAQTFTVVVTTRVKDRNGFALAREFNSTFTTVDQTPPTVAQISPANGAAQIALDANLVITADEPLARDLNLGASVQVTNGNTAVPGTLTLNEAGRVITFDPQDNLSESALYTISVNNLRDVTGNAQTQAFGSTFRTLDLTAPTIAPLSIDGTNVTTPRPVIVAQYQDNFSGVNPESVVMTLDGAPVASGISAGSASASFTPPQNLTLGNHTVTVRVADRAGNLSEIRSAAFTISDRTPPSVLAVTPAPYAVQIELNQVVTARFDEPLDPAQNFASVLKVTEFSQTVQENGAYSLSGDGQTLTFTPTTLTAGKRYSVVVKNQRDAFGNAQNDLFSSAFTTIDTVAPIISSFEINGRAATANMVVSTPQPTFDVRYQDELNIDTNAVKLYLGKVGEPLQQVPATVYSWRLFYKSQQALEPGRYKVRASVKDYAGNEAANNEFEFEFAPQQPEILSINPGYGQTSGHSIVTVSGSQLIAGVDSPNENERGLLGEYFECYGNNCLQNVKLVRVDETINFDVQDESIVPFINIGDEAVRWRGTIIPRFTETYNLTARFNGNAVVKINGQIVINGSSAAVTEAQGSYAFEADRSYDIEVQSTNLYQNGFVFYSRHVAQISWSSPSQAQEIIPAERLRPAQKFTAPTVTVGGQPAAVIGAVSGDEQDQLAVILPPRAAAGTVNVRVQNENGATGNTDEVEYYNDDSPPSVSTFSPRDGRINVAPDRPVSVTFNEPLAAGQNFNEILQVYLDSDNTRIAGSVTADDTRRRLKFVPTNEFNANTRYRVVVQGQTDTIGRVGNSPSVARFSTTDTVAPQVVFLSPTAPNYARRPVIRATFADDLSPLRFETVKLFVDEVDVTRNANVHRRCQSWCLPYYATDGVIYTPPADLSIGAHTARVQVTDEAGNTANETYNFAVLLDEQPPTISNIWLAGRVFSDGFRTAQRRPSIEVLYDDNHLITLNRQKLYFGAQGGTLNQVTPNGFRYNQQYYLSFAPPQDLPFGFYTYRVELTDDQGNQTVRVVNFEVADLDITPPRVTAVAPQSGATQVSSNTSVTLTFNEPLDRQQNFADSVGLLDNNYQIVGGEFSLDAAGTTLTFAPAQPLAENSRYYVSASGYRDAAGNGGYGFYSTFATNDTVAPSIQNARLFVDDEEWIDLNGAEIFDRQPNISVEYYDATNYVNSDSVIFTLDGQPITTGYISSSSAEYKPETPLSYGQHTITVQVADNIGNVSAVKTETFTVVKDPRTPFAVEADTKLLWRLDEADRYYYALTPDAGDYRIHGTFPPMSSSTKQRTANSRTSFDRTPRGRFGGAVENPQLTSLNDENIGSLGSDGFTVEGWMKMLIRESDLNNSRSSSAPPYVIWKKGSAAANDFELLLTSAGSLKARIFNAGGDAFEVEMPKTVFDVTDNRWHSLAMTLEARAGVPDRLAIYVDGAPRAAAPIPANFGGVRTSGGEFRLGFGDYVYSSMFDEIRVSATAHSAETIAKTYNSAELGLTATRLLPAVVPNDNTSDVTLEGYNLDVLTSATVTAVDGSPLPVTATIVESRKTAAKIRVVVPASIAAGEVKLTVSDGTNFVHKNLRVAAQRAFAADAGSLLLFHLDEPEGSPLANSGILGGHADSYSELKTGRFGNGRPGFITGNNQIVSGHLNSSFTAEFWVKTTVDREDQSLLVYGTDYDGSDHRIIELVKTTRGQLKAVLTDENNLKWEARTRIGETNLLDDQWHLISLVVARNAQQPGQSVLKIYVDGAERASAAVPANFGILESQTYYRIYLNNFRYNAGAATVDEFRFLNYARSAADIQNSWLPASGGMGILLPKVKNPAGKESRDNPKNSLNGSPGAGAVARETIAVKAGKPTPQRKANAPQMNRHSSGKAKSQN